MTLDPTLLKSCMAKAEHLIQLEHEAEHAKIDYHTEIRRLHLKGGSYREIASALGLSHQRISQIVKGASPNWLNRWIVKDDAVPKRPLCCSFCGQSQHEVIKLVAGPNVFICNGCMDISNALLGGASSKDISGFANILNEPEFLTLQSSKTHCSFCGEKQVGGQRGKPGKLVCTKHDKQSIGICQRCLAIAGEPVVEDKK